MGQGGEIFSEFRRDHRQLSKKLNDLTRPLLDVLTRAPFDSVKTDREIVDEHAAVVLGGLVPPVLLDPEDLGNYVDNHRRRIYRFSMRIDRDQSNLIDWWPDRISEAAALAGNGMRHSSFRDLLDPLWERTGELLVFRMSQWDHEPQSPVGVIFSEEAERANRIASAIEQQIEQHKLEVTDSALQIVAERRKREHSATVASASISFPKYKPHTINFAPRSESRPASTIHGPAAVLPSRLDIAEDEWAAFVSVVSRWGRAIEQNPQSFNSMHEEVLRDLLLATLNAVYPSALGEVMVRGSKSDIHVLRDPSDSNSVSLIAELKKWTDEAKAHEGVVQHLGQLSYRHTRGMLLFFVRAVTTEPLLSVHRAIESAPAFRGWSAPLANDFSEWGVARFESQQGASIEITVVTVFIDRSKITKHD